MLLSDGGDGCQLPAELRNWFCECGVVGVVGSAGESKSGGGAEGVRGESRRSPGAAFLPGLLPSWPLQGLLQCWLLPG